MSAHPLDHSANPTAEASANSTTLTLERRELFIGPLPPPEVLERYEALQPGFAERLLTLTEEQSRHRHALEVQAQRLAGRETLLGQWFGLLVALAGLGASVVIAAIGLETAASIVGGSTVVGLVSAFIIGRRADKQG